VLESILEHIVGVELSKEIFTSRARWMSLLVEWNASTNMFYLLKHHLLLILVIFELKCNNIIFNEIMILNASYVCLHAFLLHRESLDLDPGRRAPHFWGGSVTFGLLLFKVLDSFSDHSFSHSLNTHEPNMRFHLFDRFLDSFSCGLGRVHGRASRASIVGPWLCPCDASIGSSHVPLRASRLFCSN
jgi:hypothetical protein